MPRNIVIIGNGITGITAARRLRQGSEDSITVISSETLHFFSRTALMYIYMGHMAYKDTKPYEDDFWKKNRIGLIHDRVARMDAEGRKLILEKGAPVFYDILVIATGSKSNKFGWPGQDLDGVQGIYSYQDIEKFMNLTPEIEHGVVVGGGLIGIETAEMLLSRNIPVTFLVREKNFWNIVLPVEEAKMIERHIREHHVNLMLETELKEILPDENGRVKAVVTNNGETIPCQFVGLTVGVSPNIGFLAQSGIKTERGVVVNEYFETNIENIYAGGDCAQFSDPPPGRRPVEQVWYTGKMHGEHIAANILGKRKGYDPGVWFNSAKFFDIEYQTYGMVMGSLPDDQATLYWEHPSGKKAVRINYSMETEAVTGFNLLGIRGRHPVCEKWIIESAKLPHVLSHLGAMNFDPEFFEPFENYVNEKYQKETGKRLEKKTRKGLFTKYIQELIGKGGVK